MVGIDAGGVDVKGTEGTSRIEARTTIWAAGVQASPLAGLLAEASGATVDRAGRIAVLPDLTLPGHPEVFAVGDMASLDNLPGVAEVAMQGGLHAANTILRRLKGEPTKAVPLPGPRERGHHRTVPGHRERQGHPPERIPGLGGVDVRPPGLPHRLRQPVHHHVAVAPLDDRAGTGRAGVQHGPHRRRPEPPDPVKARVEPTLFPVVEEAEAPAVRITPRPPQATP